MTAELNQVSYGGEVGRVPLVGQTVAQAWRLVKAVFNIPGHASTHVNGASASPGQRLNCGDSVEFFVERGHKGVGDHVWRKEEFIELFKLESSDLDDWIADGLPVQVLPSGQVRLIESEVDVWLHDRRARVEYLKSLNRDSPEWFKPGRWYRLPYEMPPLEFGFGPLEGTKQQIAAWMYPHLVNNEQKGNHRCERATRMLEKRAGYKQVWVRRNSDNSWEAWFRHEREFAHANQNRLREQAN